jgi:hypothetical protein
MKAISAKFKAQASKEKEKAKVQASKMKAIQHENKSLKKEQASFRQHRKRHPEDPMSADFQNITLSKLSPKVKAQKLQELLVAFAEKAKTKKEKTTMSVSSSETKDSISKDDELNYMQMCCTFQLSAWENNEAKIKVMETMNWLRRVKLPLKEIQKATELKLPEAAGFKYFDTRKSAARSTSNELH